MVKRDKGNIRYILIGIGIIVWLIINIRVEAGFGTTFERAFDGMVGGAVLVASVFLALKFFKWDCDKS